MIIGDVMDEIGSRLQIVKSLRVLPYEADSVNPPCALVSLPTNINYLSTYQRGMDQMTIIVTVLVSVVDDRVRRDHIAPYGDGSGSMSIKHVLESGMYTSFDVIAVASATFDVLNIEGIDYLGAVFVCNIAGQGKTGI